MTVLTTEVAMRLDHTLQQTNALMAQQVALARLQQPQAWGLEQLRAHYPALSDDAIKALFIRHAGYTGARGKGMIVSLDAVLKVDAIVNGRVAG